MFSPRRRAYWRRTAAGCRLLIAGPEVVAQHHGVAVNSGEATPRQNVLRGKVIPDAPTRTNIRQFLGKAAISPATGPAMKNRRSAACRSAFRSRRSESLSNARAMTRQRLKSCGAFFEDGRRIGVGQFRDQRRGRGRE